MRKGWKVDWPTCTTACTRELIERRHRGGFTYPNRMVVHDRSALLLWRTRSSQKAVAETILTPIYESEFLGFSYGFRPGRGAHNALDAVAVGIERRRTEWLVDADIRGFFDNVSRAWLVRFLEYRIGDKRVIRLIIKWLNAGVMDDGEWRDDLRGTPQGAVIFANFGKHLPALCPGLVVPEEMAHPRSRRRDNHCAVRR